MAQIKYLKEKNIEANFAAFAASYRLITIMGDIKVDEVKWQLNFVSCNFGLKSNVKSHTISYWFLYGLCSEPEWPTIPQRFLETIMEEDHPDGSVGRGIALTLIEQLILGCYVLFYYALWLLNRSGAICLTNKMSKTNSSLSYLCFLAPKSSLM